MKTKSKNTSKLSKSTNTKIKNCKLLIFLLILLSIPILILANNLYKDWDNAQMIKGLARDFPQLVKDIEQATGLNLEIKNSCMTTQEKLGPGVRTCELSFFSEANPDTLSKAYEVMIESTSFSKSESFQNGEGYNALYRNKKSCGFRTQQRIYSTCITAIRERNIELAKEVFSKDLNQ